MNANLLVVGTGDADVTQQIADFDGILANWTIAFTNWFTSFLGSHILLITPLVLIFVVLGIETIRKLIHGYTLRWQTYQILVSIVVKFGSLNLLRPSGPVQACTWFVLPVHLLKSLNCRTQIRVQSEPPSTCHWSLTVISIVWGRSG